MLLKLDMKSHATEVMKFGPKLPAIDSCIKVTFDYLTSLALSLLCDCLVVPVLSIFRGDLYNFYVQ